MSVPKSKRGKSKVEFEMTYFKLADGLDNLVENYFWAEYETIQQHKLFIRLRAEAIEKLTDDLVFHIKIANSIYPTCMAEWEERRVEMGKAIGICYALLTHLQRVMMRTAEPCRGRCRKFTAHEGTGGRPLHRWRLGEGQAVVQLHQDPPEVRSTHLGALEKRHLLGTRLLRTSRLRPQSSSGD